jgi:hypothetical protein
MSTFSSYGKQVIRIIIFLLGIYEFFAVHSLWNQRDSLASSSHRFVLLKEDVITQHTPAFYLLLILYFYLGINRITWALTTQFFPAQNHFIVWLNLLLTHIAELVFFYSLALMPHFNPAGLGLTDLLPKVVSLEIGNKNSRVSLLFVPFIIFLVLLHGPDVKRRSTPNARSEKQD